MEGVSIIIPAYNAERTIAECLQAAINLRWPGAVEIVVVNDGSVDRTADITSSFTGVRLISVPNGGAARATNIGIQTALYDTVVSLDADAILENDWIEKIMPSFDEPMVGAVGGYAVTGNRSIVGRLMGYDVELRLDRMPKYTDHLYTMNTAYLRKALVQVGMFDEEMRIGYDADISRRLKSCGYRLVLRKDARCKHYWRDDLKGYLKQQSDYAYYRLNITRKFGRPHDRLVNISMLLQTPFTIFILLVAAFGSLISPFSPLLLLLLPLIHLPETIVLLLKKRDTCVLLLPLLFTIRNLVWSWAAMRWSMSRALILLRIEARDV